MSGLNRLFVLVRAYVLSGLCPVWAITVCGLCPFPDYVCVICLHIPSYAFIYLHMPLICLDMPLYVLIYLIYAFVCLNITSYALDKPSYAFICLPMPGICLHMPSYNFICLYIIHEHFASSLMMWL